MLLTHPIHARRSAPIPADSGRSGRRALAALLILVALAGGIAELGHHHDSSSSEPHCAVCHVHQVTALPPLTDVSGPAVSLLGIAPALDWGPLTTIDLRLRPPLRGPPAC